MGWGSCSHFQIRNIKIALILDNLGSNIVHDGEFLTFAIEHYSEMFGYINTGRVNIRIHRDITGEMWFGVGSCNLS